MSSLSKLLHHLNAVEIPRNVLATGPCLACRCIVENQRLNVHILRGLKAGELGKEPRNRSWKCLNQASAYAVRFSG